jgi:hypothetical protein
MEMYLPQMTMAGISLTSSQVAGSVHGCGLCTDSDVLFFVEDVGRHAVRKISFLTPSLNRLKDERKFYF